MNPHPTKSTAVNEVDLFGGSTAKRLLHRALIRLAFVKDPAMITELAPPDFLPGAQKLADVFIGKALDYTSDIKSVIQRGLETLGVTPNKIVGKRILLKPNLVETFRESVCINTHPAVVRAAVEIFLSFGAAHVTIAEGAGHRRDSIALLEESGMGQVVAECGVRFVDLNYAPATTCKNRGGASKLKHLILPRVVMEADWVVSMAKMKTHHWAGVTLSMKNLFGVMPGLHYGWPKNVLHHSGIHECIFDINATVKPHFAIVDGIVGMEGDGPIMGTAKSAGVLVMGQNLPAVDATCTRIMGIEPSKIRYLAASPLLLGPIHEDKITQRGEPIQAVRTEFGLLDHIPVQSELRRGEG